VIPIGKQTNHKKETGLIKGWAIAINFGLTLGLTIYILGMLIGVRLDEKLQTSPLFVILGTLIAIGASFYRLILEVKALEKPAQNKKTGSKEDKNGI